MKKYLTGFLCIGIVFGIAKFCFADYLGSWGLEDTVTITATLHQFSTGAAYDPSAITFFIYEQGIGTAIQEASLYKTDSKTGFYTHTIETNEASGFEEGKDYIVLIRATVDSVEAIGTHRLQIKAKVDSDKHMEF